jgi:peptidoglycan/xylan/chitin deacetylase (PgdA/CDA1 family)
MSRWTRRKDLALRLYYYTTLPNRWLWNKWLAKAGRLPIVILFYHRVAQQQDNPWTIANHRFETHLRWLGRRYEFISLAETQRRLRDGCSHQPAVSITFDDGYADNCEFALPYLIKHRIPCTYFVSSHNVLEGHPFPHDVQNGLPLRTNTEDQIRALAAAGIEIGTHTKNHVDLGKVTDPAALNSEIVSSREQLESVIQRPVRYFAAPYGFPNNISVRAIELIRASGFKGFCSAFGGYNHPGQDTYHLRRIHGDPEFIRLKNWVSIDPRKRYVGQQFVPTNFESMSARNVAEP